MSAPHITPAVKFIRLGVGLSLLLLTAAVVAYFAARRPGLGRPVPAAGPNEPKAGLSEGVRYREYRNGKVRADVRARRSFKGRDGLIHLEEDVEILDYAGGEGPETRITADQVVYNEDMTRFAISGHARVHTPEIDLESPALDYDRRAGVLSTDKGGIFSSGRLAGSAPSITFDGRRNEIRLGRGFRLDFKSGSSSALDLSLSGDSFLYRRNERAGEVEGRARASRGSLEATAGLLKFELTEGEAYFRSMALTKAAKFAQVGPGPGGSGHRSVEAEAVQLDFEPDSFRTSGLVAQGNCRVAVTSSSDPSVRIQAASVRMAFDKQDQLAGLDAAGKVLGTIEGRPGEVSNLEADDFSYAPTSGVLLRHGGDGRSVLLDSEKSRIEAASVRLEPGPANVEASGGVKCLLKPGTRKTAVGFFSAEVPLFITSLTMTSDGKDRRHVFTTAVRIWQDKISVRAGELDISEESGEIRCRGGVTIGFPDSSAAPPDEGRIEVAGQEMAYTPENRTINFEKKAIVRLAGARLQADSVVARLKAGKYEVGFLSGQGSVVINQGRYEGRGEAAAYDPEAGTIILQGHPVLAGKDGETTKADKLTFHRGDGRILIENKGQGRSITVVKS
jgi:lipopolysaccharide export system protein LptA